MTDRFKKFIPFILEWETVYGKGGRVLTEHDPDDPGGTTRYGIDQRSHPKVNVENLTKDQAIAIYFQEWTEQGIESMKYPLGEVFFNCSVNAGLGRAKQFYGDSKENAGVFLDHQEDFYRRLADRKPSARKYLKGWLNRTTSLRKFVGL